MAAYSGKVIGGQLALRATPNGAFLKWIPNGTSLGLTSSTDTAWWNTTYDGSSGCVMARYIEVTSGGKWGYVSITSGTLYVRSGPGTGYGSVYSLGKDASIYYLYYDGSGTWLRISTSQGSGWVAARYTTVGELPFIADDISDGCETDPENRRDHDRGHDHDRNDDTWG